MPILRLEDVTGGVVRIDGNDVRELRIADLRRACGLVSQDVFLFHGTAEIVTDPQLEEALLAHPFEPWALPDDKGFWVRVEVASITGRRIVRP